MNSRQIALFGNPNTGKTSLFNALTGSYEYVGNWSGVTVEKKVGLLRHKQGMMVDLPGVYTLSPLSRDEGVVTDFLLNESFSDILNIVDASQLKRNLHLTVQLLECGHPLTIGLNMIDVAGQRGIFIDHQKMSAVLGVPVIPVIARSGKGCDELSRHLLLEKEKRAKPLVINYGSAVEEAIGRIESIIPERPGVLKRWMALQYLEGNSKMKEQLEDLTDGEKLKEIYEETEKRLLQEQSAKSLHQHIYNERERWIDRIMSSSVEYQSDRKQTLTERVDQIVTHQVLGIPIFLLFMYLMFMLTFDWLGVPLSDALDGFIGGPLTEWTASALAAMGASPFIEALILDGIIAGVGGVLVFVPQIFILFFFISVLEDSGYMARVAMVMDRLMEAIGLNGKAFIPLIIGFGCNVPGVMAARTVEQPKERLLTIMLMPFMSCSARLPVYALFAGAFFAAHQAFVVLSLYVLGIAAALVLAKFLSSSKLKEEKSFFVIELPPYRLPQARTLWRATWEKGKGFVRKAGTYIFGGSVLIWFLSYTGPGGTGVEMDDSFLAMIGGVLAPLLMPLGFGTWQAAASLLTGFLAKEVVVASMSIIYFVPEAQLQGMMAEQFTPLAAYGFMAFVLLYVPCLATVAVIKKETNSKKWMFLSIVYGLAIAYVIAFLIYQGGRLLGLS
ncbi:ferrous iron transport protein B [Bacillus paralicheniformis]|uniref:ferrous iron transport protein B n=1 Tax=Bacillus paralicheniformis TaxID=1648923 RepID=UPI000D02628B|nr:ferrous iron transport protein B [Bacillus paralicheniformis]MDE1384212.1 ferrous iron transport protein B [Bacillus paralicheniformis]PRS11060.1 ferrous iron transport protein B [Bacillus paralicheniformis]